MLLKARKISKTYKSKTLDELQILKSVDFDVQEGESVSIVGSSGAGKSTFLNILASIDNPDSGEILYYFDNKEVNINKLTDSELSNIRNKEIGFIFQFHHLLPEFNAIENIMIPAMIAKKSGKYLHKRAEELIDYIGLSARKKHRPAELSGGEQQRIAIARALINNPKIIFADEPTGNLDKKNSEMVLSLISKLQSELKLTFVTATHSEMVASYSNRKLKINDGYLEDYNS